MDSVAQCSSCRMRNMCITGGIDDKSLESVDSIITDRLKIKKGDFLYCEDEEFSNIYALKLGHFKTFKITTDGNEQITNFALAGEMLGFDAFANQRYGSYAQAIEDSELCVIPSKSLENLFLNNPKVLKQFNKLLSSEIRKDSSMMILLGSMTADQKFAYFLLDLSSRYAQRGLSSTNFHFRMSREDIGNYLGLTIESISRVINRFKQNGLIEVQNKEISIKNLEVLRNMMN